MSIAPLNGTKTHPLSAHALDELRDIAKAPVPRLSINPGCANRLARGGLVESVLLPSPFKSHHGMSIEHMRITADGQLVLDGQP